MRPTKVIFDTDPGIDDAMALLYLHRSPEIELVGITTVLGNGSVETTTRNALYLRQRFGITAPVAKGAAAPLNGVIDAVPVAVHGENGLGDIELPEPTTDGLDPRSAAQFIIDTVRANPGEITLIAIGRMTNLALALQQDPGIAPLVKQVVIMGGAFGYRGHSGNVSPVAEANIHGDPEAADEIFGAAWPVVVVGLDVTHEALMTNAFLDELGETGADGKLLWDMTRVYAQFYGDVAGVDGVFAHDSLAVAYVIKPDWFVTRGGPIRVVTEGIAVGQTIQQSEARKFGSPAWANRPSHKICIEVEADEILAHYLKVVGGK